MLKGISFGHQDGASSFQLMERSFPRPTSMALSVLKFRVVILPGSGGSTMAEVGSGGDGSDMQFIKEVEIACTSVAILSSPMT